MPEEQSAELVALCASIMEDGEVTSDEAYQLAEWLNNHSDAAEHWPGSELIQPLQEIWADGVVGARELHRLARLLISVQRQWARHPETQIVSVTNQPAPRFSQLDVDDVRLPNLQGTFRVPSQSEPGRFYKVDLSGPSCSCPDWRGQRSRLPIGDLTRCCKHIMHVYATLVRKDADGWLAAFIENGWPSRPKAKWHLLTVGANKVLFCTVSEKGWADVFAKDGGKYARFGFNPDESRWAYEVEPEGAASIATAIKESGNSVSPSFPRFELPRPLEIPKSVPKALPKAVAAAQPRRSAGWIAAIAVVAFAFVVAGVMMLHGKEHLKFPTAGVPSSSESAAGSAAAVPTPAHAVAASHIDNSSARPPKVPWNVKTLRAVWVEIGRANVVIPKGTQLRVVARADSDLMVSYKGSTVTIPAGATDVH